MAPMVRALASLMALAMRAEKTDSTATALTPLCLLATMHMPAPVPQKRMARSALPSWSILAALGAAS